MSKQIKIETSQSHRCNSHLIEFPLESLFQLIPDRDSIEIILNDSDLKELANQIEKIFSNRTSTKL